MVYSEKEQQYEGALMATLDVIEEAKRLKSLAQRYAMELASEGISQKELSLLDRARDQVEREHGRLEAPPAKPKVLERAMQQTIERAYRWRATLVNRAERLHFEDRSSRLAYRRGIALHGIPERMYEELSFLLEAGRRDLNRFAREHLLDEAFLDMGDDLRYELHGLEAPDRQAWAKYEEAKRKHRYGPPPKPPEPPPKLPEVLNNAATLNGAKGYLYSRLRRVSAAGQAAFSAFEGREKPLYAQLRQDFVLRVRPIEYDPSLVFLGDEKAAKAGVPNPHAALRERKRREQGASAGSAPGPVATRTSPTAAAPGVSNGLPVAPAPDPVESDEKRAERLAKKKRKKPKRIVNPGGAPPPVGDTLHQPPPGALGLVRPSTTRGRK